MRLCRSTLQSLQGKTSVVESRYFRDEHQHYYHAKETNKNKNLALKDDGSYI